MCLAPASSCWLSCAFPAGLKGPFRACSIPGTFLWSGFKAPLDPPWPNPRGFTPSLLFSGDLFSSSENSPPSFIHPLLFAKPLFNGAHFPALHGIFLMVPQVHQDHSNPLNLTRAVLGPLPPALEGVRALGMPVELLLLLQPLNYFHI